MSQDFGSHLKHEREMRGISLEEIAASTKIQIQYLQALENNQFDELPGEIFVKGFIRSYGKTIGCNAEDLISAYDEAMGPRRVDTAENEQDVEDPHRTPGSSFRNNLFGVVAVVLVLAVGVWYLNAPQPESFPKPEDFPVAEVPDSEVVMEHQSAPAKEGIERKPSPSLKEPAADRPPAMVKAAGPAEKAVLPGQPNQAPGQHFLANGVSKSENDAIMETTQDQLIQNVSGSLEDSSAALDRLQLVIRVSENSWFNLKIDSRREMDFIMPAGASKTILAQAEIRITVGNQRATHLTLNDQVLALPESPDNVVRNLIVNTDLIE